MPKRDNGYDPYDKTFRDLPIIGMLNETIEAGLRVTFHDRLYALIADTTIPPTAPHAIGVPNKFQGIGRFKLVTYL
ncbi:MAG: hypothetical protein WC648_02900 [Candidatus Paceibacterota bacterium]